MQKHGVQIYPGSGKHPWDRAEDGHPPRSHKCMPEETEFAETHQEKPKSKQTIMMWRKALDHTWQTRIIEATQKNHRPAAKIHAGNY